MRIESGTTDTYVYFYALDETDHVTPLTGLSSFTIYRSRQGGLGTAWTSPTIVEVSSANMPGFYALLVDEDTTISSGWDVQHMALTVSHTGMKPVPLVIELYRTKITRGETLATADIATIDTNVDDIETAVGLILIDTAEIGAAGAGLTDIPWNSDWDAEIESEVQDALAAAHTEPTGVPASNESLADKIGYLFRALRNRLDVDKDTGKKTFYNDAGSAEFEQDLTDDGTTYSQSQINSV